VWCPAANEPAARRAAVTVCRPAASTSPTNNTTARWNVRPVNAIENPDTTGSTAAGSDTSEDTDDIADSFPHACA
jgi:hypothetical protein